MHCSDFLEELGQSRPTAGQTLTGSLGQDTVLWCSQPKNHGNQPKTMKNHETTLKNQGNQPKTMKNHETTLKNHGNQPKTMKNHGNQPKIMKNYGKQPIAIKPPLKTMETNKNHEKP